MSSPNERRRLYEIHCSQEVAQSLKDLHQKAMDLGRGAEFLAGLRLFYHRLENDPQQVGEALYHLHHLKLQVRVGIILPLAMTFAVHEVERLVFIQSVVLL